MTTANLFLFAGVYFVMVISPGPGIAAVIARRVARDTVGPRLHRGFRGGRSRMVYRCRNRPFRYRTNFRNPLSCHQISRLLLLAFHGMENLDNPNSNRWNGIHPRKIEPLVQFLGLPFNCPRKPESDNIFPVNHAAGD